MLVLLLASCASAPTPTRPAAAARPEAMSPTAPLPYPTSGLEFSFPTDRGPVHVFVPSGFDPKTAGVVVYVHGYYTNVDQAWAEHQLAAQFSESHKNAVFIAPEAPAGQDEPVAWARLDELLYAVFDQERLEQPAGPLTVIGHSGAYRTILGWLGHPRLELIILLDAFYSSPEAFGDWLVAPGAGETASKRLVLVAVNTYELSETFTRSYPFTVRREGIPSNFYPAFSEAERGTRLLYILGQFDHMQLVTAGVAIPALIELTGLPGIARQAKKMPWE